jgi:serine protease Do
VEDSKELPRIVAATPVGKTVTVKVLRNGKEISQQVKIAEMEEAAVETAKAPAQKNLGLTVQALTPQTAQQLGVKPGSGVVVTRVEPGSAAEEAMLRTGDVIREVDRRPVRNAQEFAQQIAKAKPKQPILLLIQRGENALFVAVTPK